MLYYLPDMNAPPTLEALAERGLGHAFDQSPMTRGPQRGPDGQQGIICSQVGQPDSIGYWPDRQTWTQLPAANGSRPCWFGRFQDRSEDPADLQRPEQLPGHPVKLADGQDWLIPVARLMPKVYQILPDGQWTAVPQTEHVWMWELADRYLVRYLAAMDAAESEYTEAGKIPPDVLPFSISILPADVEAAVRLLGVNYRLGPHEVSALGLLTPDSINGIYMALLDDPEKKKRTGTRLPLPDSGPAGPGSSISPAGLTS